MGGVLEKAQSLQRKSMCVAALRLEGKMVAWLRNWKGSGVRTGPWDPRWAGGRWEIPS